MEAQAIASPSNSVRGRCSTLLQALIKPRLLSLTLLAMWGLALLQQQVPAQEPPTIATTGIREDFHLFLLIGQSNMAGRGSVAAKDQVVNNRVLMLNHADQWVPAVAPMHNDKPKIVGVGPGRAFALAYAREHPDATVGLVPCASGGSAIDSWTPGGYHEQTDSHPYDDAIRRAKLALQSGVLKGILWHQGESDSQPGLAEGYQGKLHALINRLRKELNANEVPFMIGQMGQFSERPWDDSRQLVDQSQAQLVRSVPNTTYVPSGGLNHKGDEIHFDSASARELGLRYYESFQWSISSKPVLELHPDEAFPRKSEGDFIRLNDGSLLFIYTRFRTGASDHDAAELVSRVSNDDGQSWSNVDALVLRNEGQMNVMSVSLLRLHDGRIALFYLVKNSLSDCRPVVRFSSDEAKSWSEPIQIIPDEETGYFVLNNDRVVQLEPGRLVVPVARHASLGSPKPDWSGEVTAYFSDDFGATWFRSSTLQAAYDAAGNRIAAQEPGIVELRDGRLMMWIRTDAGLQYQSHSENRGETWSPFVATSIASPRSPATIERIPATGDLLAIWNDHSHLPVNQRTQRTPLSLAISQDEGLTWTKSLTLAADPDGWYCYSALEFSGDHCLIGHSAGHQLAGQQLGTTAIRRIELRQLYQQLSLSYLLDVRRIWSQARHNAFTDLARFQNRWYCVFREGHSHVSPEGSLRVIVSDDGISWKSSALLSNPHADLRDAKLTTTPGGELMLSGAAAMHNTSEFKHQSLSWFSADGENWSPSHSIGERDYWLWRTTWHAGTAYAIGYQTNTAAADRHVRLYHSQDGKRFDKLVDQLVSQNYPNESSMIFQPDGQCYCLLRRDADSATGMLGVSAPPYTEWSWRDLGHRIGGPHMLQLPDGRFVAAVRLYDGVVRTSLCWLEPKTATLTEFLRLPSGGDCSYPGLVWHDNRLWVSYYSSHEAGDFEFNSAIYLAQVRLPLAQSTTQETEH
ncbi:MAG: exo-alpha-sialidase [Planctomycetales bacterium]|nr:exo-alpha-sialidase [Planctomycetales bacterium]